MAVEVEEKKVEHGGTTTGVNKEVLRKGDGVTFPQKGQRLKMHYKGTLASNGQQFDSTYDKKKPFSFIVGKGTVLPGWEEGVLQMSVGEKAKLHCSSEVCYGPEGCDGIIPPNADLIFEVELLEIEFAPQAVDTKSMEDDTHITRPEQQPLTSQFTSFFTPVPRPEPLNPDSTLDQELQNSADDANLTLYFVNMVVVSASDLANTDVALIDTSEPYCEIQIGQLTNKTETIYDNLNPVWNESMAFFVPQKPDKMLIRVKDTNSTLQDDDVGAAEFEFGSFFDIGGSFQGDIELMMPNGKPKGTIKINLKCRTLKPVETEIKLGYVEKKLQYMGIERDQTVAALDESEELRKQVVNELGSKEQEVLKQAAKLEQAVTEHNKELSAKDQALLDRAQEIEAKIQEKEEAEVARRQAELEKMQAETKLTQAEKEILRKADLLEEKERNNKAALTEKEKEILAMGDQLEAKEEAAKSVQKRLLQVEALKTEVENELTSKDKIIQEQAKQLELKAKETGEALSKKDQELLEKAKALEERDAAAKEAQRKQDASNAELQKLRREKEALEAKAEAAAQSGGCGECTVM